jgi:hypothetical protein
VLMFESWKSRLVLDGIVPPGHEVAVDQLKQRGVADSRIIPDRGEIRGTWQAADRIRHWLDQHAGAHIVVLCDRFSSRRLRYILDRVLSNGQSARVALRTLRDRRYDESDWWRSRTGFKAVFGAYFGLAYSWVAGRPESYAKLWDPDEYEEGLRAQGLGSRAGRSGPSKQ